MTARIVYTDGACKGNPGPGGWGWYVPSTGESGCGGEPQTTNNRMELTAVIEAVKALEGELEIYSDSKYIVDCIHQKWWVGWLRRNWLTSQKKPVKNQDLWKSLLEALQERDIEFVWVEGHSGDPGNDAADALATAAAELY